MFAFKNIDSACCPGTVESIDLEIKSLEETWSQTDSIPIPDELSSQISYPLTFSRVSLICSNNYLMIFFIDNDCLYSLYNVYATDRNLDLSELTLFYKLLSQGKQAILFNLSLWEYQFTKISITIVQPI